jgi:sugar-specific transcriptional regulator TrmB
MDVESGNKAPSPRISLELNINYRRSYGRRIETATIKNISLSGAFIEIDPDIEVSPNEKVIVSLSVGDRVRKIPALVVWKNKTGCGIKFNHLNNRDQQIVDDLIYFVENSKHDQKTVLNDIFKSVA